MTIGATALTDGISFDTGVTIFDTASITPSANKLICLWLQAGTLVDPEDPIITGCGLTWAQEDTVLWANATNRVYLYRATGGTPTTDTITMEFPDQLIGLQWAVVEYDNVDTSGTSGSGAIVQSVATAIPSTATSHTITLAAFGSAANATAGMMTTNKNEAITNGSGFTETTEEFANSGAVNRAIQTQFRSDNDTTVDWSWASTTPQGAGIAIELKHRPTINKSESITVTENAKVTLVHNVRVSDTITVTENVSAVLPMNATHINVAEFSAGAPGQTTHVSASFTPIAGQLLLVTSTSEMLEGVVGTNSISNTHSGSWSWTQVTDSFDLFLGDEGARLSIFYAIVPASPGAGTVTVTFSNNRIKGVLQLTAVTQVSPTTPVIQSANNEVTSTSALTVTLGSASVANSMLFGAAVGGLETANATNIAPGSGFVELNETMTTDGFFEQDLMVEYDPIASGATTINWSNFATGATRPDRAWGIGLEIASILNTGLSINVSDSITVTDTPTVRITSFVNKSESITVSEAVNVTLINHVSVSDTVTITEATTVRLASSINVSDTITTTENVVVFVPFLVASVSDSIAVTESVSMLLSSFINKSDSITVSESTNVSLVLSVSVSDTITVSESTTVRLNIFVIESESIIVTENVVVFIPVLLTNVNDTITVSESLKLLLTSFVNVSDSITITENKTIAIVGGTLSVNVSDSIAVTEALNVVVVQAGMLMVNKSESITVTESVNLSASIGDIAVSDTIIVGEGRPYGEGTYGDGLYGDPILILLLSFINEQENITITESVSAVETMSVSVSDTITVSESTAVSLTSFVSVSDSVTVTESVTVRETSFITVSDTITLSENVAMLISIAGIAVSDVITISESVVVVFDLLSINVSDLVTVSENVIVMIAVPVPTGIDSPTHTRSRSSATSSTSRSNAVRSQGNGPVTSERRLT